MVRRTAKRGPTPGKDFFGCSRFPECRGLRNIDGPKHWTEVKAEYMAAVTGARDTAEILAFLREHRDEDDDFASRTVAEFADEIDEPIVDEILRRSYSLAPVLAAHPSCGGGSDGRLGDYLAERLLADLANAPEHDHRLGDYEEALRVLIGNGLLTWTHPISKRLFAAFESSRATALGSLARTLLVQLPIVPEEWLIALAPAIGSGSAVRHPDATPKVLRASILGATYMLTRDKVEAFLEHPKALEDSEIRQALAPYLAMTNRRDGVDPVRWTVYGLGFKPPLVPLQQVLR